MNGCAYASVVILLVTGVFATAAFGTSAYVAIQRWGGRGRAATSASVIVPRPTFIAGPAIEMSLPGGSNLASSSVDADGGNWWYENGAGGHLHLLIAASRVSGQQQQLSDAYFQRVMRIVERSGSDRITAMDPVQDVRIGLYDGREAAYDVVQPDGASEHAMALLVRRESDDLLIILYGDGPARDEVDSAARQMFASLHPRPTPQQYDVHSADANGAPAARRGVRVAT